MAYDPTKISFFFALSKEKKRQNKRYANKKQKIDQIVRMLRYIDAVPRIKYGVHI